MNGSIAAGSGPWNGDGMLYMIMSPPGGYGGFYETEYQEYTGATGYPNNGGLVLLNSATAATYQNVYKGSIFTALGTISGGTPANNSPVSASPKDTDWCDVEI